MPVPSPLARRAVPGALFAAVLLLAPLLGPHAAFARWTQVNDDGFGDPNNKGVAAAIIFQQYLVVTTRNNVSGTQVWRIPVGDTDPSHWVRVDTGQFSASRDAEAMAVFNDELYIGTGDGAIFRRFDFGQGWYWMAVDPAEWTHPGRTISSLHVQNGKLYAARENPAASWRTVDGLAWSPWGQEGMGNTPNNYGARLAGSTLLGLYAGTYVKEPVNPVEGCEVRRGIRGLWRRINTPGFGDPWNLCKSMAIFKGTLYVGTVNHNGNQIWRRTPGGWEDVSPCRSDDPFSPCIPRVQALATTKGALFAAFGGGGSSTGRPGVAVLKTTDGVNWTYFTDQGNNAFGDANNFAINTLTVAGKSRHPLRYYIYAGTHNDATGAEVWLHDPGVIFP